MDVLLHGPPTFEVSFPVYDSDVLQRTTPVDMLQITI